MKEAEETGIHTGVETGGQSELEAVSGDACHQSGSAGLSRGSNIADFLKSSERLLRLLTDKATDAIILLDEDTRIHFWSPAATTIFGYLEQEALGHEAYILLPSNEDRAKAKEFFTGDKAAISDRMEFSTTRRDGNPILVEASGSRFNIEDNHGMILFIRDISAERANERELVESKTRLEFILKSCRAAIYTAKTYVPYQCTYKSESIRDIVGFDAHTLIENPNFWMERVHPEDRDYACSEVARIYDRERHEYEYRFLHDDNTYHWLRDEMRLVRDELGEPKEIIGSISDVTELRIAMEQIEQSREQLRALAARVESVREGERRKIAREVHDVLGQALTSLKIDLKDLEKNMPSGNENRFKIEAMLEIIDDNIELIRKISSELRPGPLEELGLAAAVEWEVDGFRKRTGINCILDCMIGENRYDDIISTALFRILQEALTNVVRHSEADMVEIELQEDSGKIVLQVKDNGKGIEQDELCNVNSMGILSMRERAFLLGGELAIEGSAAQGTTVRATIPAAKGDEVQFGRQASRQSEPGHDMIIKVMIVDDQAVVRRGLAKIINDEKDMILAAEACNASEALALARGVDINVALVDIIMPDKNGIELLKELRAETPEIHVLMLSIYPEDQYAMRCMRAGASGYLTKDAAPDMLVEAIRAVKSGRKFITPAVAERIAFGFECGGSSEPHDRLSDREFEVARQIAAGKLGKEIASELKLSNKTISTYRSRVLKKLGLHSNADITRHMIENNLL